MRDAWRSYTGRCTPRDPQSAAGAHLSCSRTLSQCSAARVDRSSFLCITPATLRNCSRRRSSKSMRIWDAVLHQYSCCGCCRPQGIFLRWTASQAALSGQVSWTALTSCSALCSWLGCPDWLIKCASTLRNTMCRCAYLYINVKQLRLVCRLDAERHGFTVPEVLRRLANPVFKVPTHAVDLGAWMQVQQMIWQAARATSAALYPSHLYQFRLSCTIAWLSVDVVRPTGMHATSLTVGCLHCSSSSRCWYPSRLAAYACSASKAWVQPGMRHFPGLSRAASAAAACAPVATYSLRAGTTHSC